MKIISKYKNNNDKSYFSLYHDMRRKEYDILCHFWEQGLSSAKVLLLLHRKQKTGEAWGMRDERWGMYTKSENLDMLYVSGMLKR